MHQFMLAVAEKMQLAPALPWLWPPGMTRLPASALHVAAPRMFIPTVVMQTDVIPSIHTIGAGPGSNQSWKCVLVLQFLTGKQKSICIGQFVWEYVLV